MRYDEFLERYKAAQREWRLGRVDAREALAGLRDVVPAIDDQRLQQTAGFLIDRWAAHTSPDARERMSAPSGGPLQSLNRRPPDRRP